VLRGAEVIATVGPASQPRVAALGASQVLDYHDPDWPGQARALTGRRGVAAAANAAPGGAASAIRAVADGGRLATITSDPPSQQRGITVSSIYVRADGNQLRELAQQFGDGRLLIPVAASYRLADAAQPMYAGLQCTLSTPDDACYSCCDSCGEDPARSSKAVRGPLFGSGGL